jgi:hypothetical protein
VCQLLSSDLRIDQAIILNQFSFQYCLSELTGRLDSLPLRFASSKTRVSRFSLWYILPIK